MSYDTKCRNLAEDFARDWTIYDSESTESKQALVGELAQRIQDAIEEFETEKGLNR